MMTKQDVLRKIEALPDDASLEQIAAEIDRLAAEFEQARFKAKVEEGLEALDRGDWVSHEEAKKRLRKWRAS